MNDIVDDKPAEVPVNINTAELDYLIAMADREMANAHQGQVRKNTGVPYNTHPRAVAETVTRTGRPIALLHDVIEDNPKYTATYLRSKFPDWIVDRVVMLTRKEGEEYVNYIMRVAKDPLTRAVKFSDLMHNSSDLNNGSLRDKYLLARKLLEMVGTDGLYAFKPEESD